MIFSWPYCSPLYALDQTSEGLLTCHYRHPFHHPSYSPLNHQPSSTCVHMKVPRVGGSAMEKRSAIENDNGHFKGIFLCRNRTLLRRNQSNKCQGKFPLPSGKFFSTVCSKKEIVLESVVSLHAMAFHLQVHGDISILEPGGPRVAEGQWRN